MIGLIAIEGAAGDAREPATGYEGSFVHDLYSNWYHPQFAHYFAGPQPPELSFKPFKSVRSVADDATKAAIELWGNKDVKGIFFAAYSLGAASAVLAARTLKAVGIKVDCMALYDGVDTWPPMLQVGWAPTNVQYLVHGYRSRAAGSRPLWGNCATSTWVRTCRFSDAQDHALGRFRNDLAYWYSVGCGPHGQSYRRRPEGRDT